MKQSKVLKTILFVSGLIGVVFGGAILFMPVAFSATNGIDLSGNINLLNETRPAGGALLACGTVILAGAFLTELTFTATVISTVMYLAYGSSRLLSIAIDGLPVESLIQATIVETLIGMLSVFALLKYRKT